MLLEVVVYIDEAEGLVQAESVVAQVTTALVEDIVAQAEALADTVALVVASVE